MAEILVIAPHPDDEVFGCGGTMARHADAGDRVHVVIVTRGSPEVFPPESVDVVRREAERAHRLLGVASCRYLDFPAPKMDQVAGHIVADELRKILLEIRPEVVYVPHCGDIHADHKVVFWAACVAARPAVGFQVSRLLSYETLSETEWGPPPGGSAFAPTVFVDITAQLERKLRAASEYVSQLRDAPHPRSLTCLKALARLRGSAVCIEAAEAFVLVREVAR
jgi:LmbE family N-acetylglucosaminyl deacetylase